MNETMRQHFVNCSYLANWDLNRPTDPRKAIIHWTDGTQTSSGTTESLGFENYLYKKSGTKISEGYFGEFEGDWNEIVQGIHSRTASRHLMSTLLMQAVVLHLRNPRNSLEKAHERFTPTVKAIDTVLNKLLVEGKITNSVHALSLAIQDAWEFRIFRQTQNCFLTSDNPSVFLSYAGNPLSIVCLPISPSLAFLASRRSQLKVFRNVLTARDVRTINSYVTANTGRMAFSYEPFTASQVALVADLKQRNRRRGMISKKTFRLNALKYPLADMPLPLTII